MAGNEPQVGGRFNAAKITPGEAKVRTGMNADVILARNGKVIDFGDAIYHPDNVANAALYAEAHNVANETGMTPRELLAKLREAEAENARLVEECHRMAAILVTDDDLGPRRELAEKDDFEDPFNGGFSDESNPTLTLPADER